MRFRGIVAILLATLLPGAASAQAPDRIKVVATFSILADLVRNVGGEAVEVASLVGPEADAHVFSPSPQDARVLAGARLVVVNGLGFEGWMNRLVKASGFKGTVVTASRGVKPLREEGHSHDHGHGHSHGAQDPHAWQDVANTKIYVANIRDALARIDPPRADAYRTAAAAYLARLDRLDADIRTAFAAIPRERRKVITSHDAFAYYGRAYGITFLSPQGISTEAEASAKDVAELIRQIRRENVRSVFVETITDHRLVERIAAEAGATMGGALYSDALSGPAGPASTYLDMMRHNTGRIAASMAR